MFDGLITSNFTSITPYMVLIPIIIIFILWSRQRTTLPPGPYGLPFIGCLLMLTKGRSSEIFINLQKKYGDVFSLRLGQYLYIVINGNDALTEAFVKNGDVYSARSDLYLIDKINDGMGIGQASGELWKTSRTFALQSLRGFGFGRKSLESKILEEVQSFIQYISKQNGKPFDVSETSHMSTANIISKIAFSKTFNEGDKSFERLLPLMDQGMKLIAATGLGMILPALRFLPGDALQIHKCIECFKDIKEFLKDIVKEHEASFDGVNIRDYVDVFIQEKRKQEAMGVHDVAFSDQNLIASLMTLFFGGTETTATTIKWAIVFLIRHRSVQEKAHREIERVIGSSRYPCLEDQPNMDYLNAVITEVMRIRPVAPLSVPHGVMNDTTLKGYTIPKGAVVIQNLESVMMDPGLFPEPQNFDPSRFIDNDGKFLGHKNVVPFSLGRRKCLGESLARNELFLFLTSLIQRFQLHPENENQLPPLTGTDGVAYCPLPFKFRAIERY